MQEKQTRSHLNFLSGKTKMVDNLGRVSIRLNLNHFSFPIRECFITITKEC